MRVALACLALLLMAVCSCVGPRSNPQPADEPPRQTRPWHPPGGMPANLLSALNTLFEQGFPDPRGCEYREIELEVGSIWGRKELARTRGWVLPAKSDVAQRYAIAWNGVIYPVSSVGAMAGLHEEAASLPPAPSRRFNSGAGEVWTVYSTNAFSSGVMLLARVGEVQAALNRWVPDEQTRTQMQLRMEGPAAGIGTRENYDPYLELAGDWAWAQFDHVLCAHMQGETSIALPSARRLAKAASKIEREAAKRAFPRPLSADRERQEQEAPYLGFLDELPRLLSDLERRGREGKRESVVQTGLERILIQAERIRALIKDLDLVQARQWSQPGGVDLTQDPIVAALIKEGDAAVEPVLECLETDKRLTCSVAFHRDFFRSRTVLSVASAARTALQAILHTEFTSGTSEIRAYWKQFKGTRLEDRWYAVLNDDNAGLARWKEAAANITQPDNVTTVPGTGFSQTEPPAAKGPIRMRGESLRANSDPSVAALMARRATEVRAPGVEDYDLAVACEIALSLAAWDHQAVGPVAKLLVQRCRTAFEYSTQPGSWPVQRLGTFIAQLTTASLRAGHPQVLEDYTAWIKTATGDSLGSYLLECLEPLGEFSGNASVQAAAESLFGSTNSPLGNLPWKGAAGFRDPIESGLVKVPAFRRLLARELDKTAVIGSVQWEPEGQARYRIDNYKSGSRSLALPRSSELLAQTPMPLRWCDWIAWSLSAKKQIPFFNPFATIEQRDRAIAEAKAVLNGH